MSTGAIIAAVAFILGILTWIKTRRVGPVIGVAFAAIVVIMLADPSMLDSLATTAKEPVKTLWQALLTAITKKG